MENGLNARKRARTTILALVLAGFGGLFGAPASAGDLSVLVNGKAIHLDEQPGVTYNEKNWGLGFQYDMPTAGEKWVPFVTASGFDDSNKNMSYYAGGGYLHRSEFNWGKTPMHLDAGAVAFVMKRKNFKNGDPFLGVLPAVSLGTPRVSVNVTYIPKVDPKMVPVLFFQLKITLN